MLNLISVFRRCGTYEIGGWKYKGRAIDPYHHHRLTSTSFLQLFLIITNHIGGPLIMILNCVS